MRRGMPSTDSQRAAVRWVGLAFALFGFVSLIPALPHANLGFAPGWAQAIAVVALLLWAYAAWIALTPDWGTLWTAMIVAGSLAAFYAMGAAICLLANPRQPMVLDFGELRRDQGIWPAGWCAFLMLAASALAYRCGKMSAAWRGK